MAASGGITAHVYRDKLLLYNGCRTDMLWWLNLSTFVWDEGCCLGVFPPLTRFYATALCGSRLYVCGGEPLCPGASPAIFQHDLLELFVADLSDLRWEQVTCDWKPHARSHHTITAVNDSTLVVIGGKPLMKDVTSYEMRDIVSSYFYAVHVFEIASGSWRVFSQTPFPCLWGHSTHVVNSSAVVIFGGFEVTLESGDTDEELPTVMPSNSLLFLNHRTMECYRAGTRISGRALHQSHICGHKMWVLGGLSMDESRLRLVSQYSAVEVSLVSFETRSMTFCLQHWPLDHLATAVYNGRLIVLNTTDHIFVRQVGGQYVWERYLCDAAGLATSPFLFAAAHFIASSGQSDRGGSNTHANDRTSVLHGCPLPLAPSLSPVLWATISRLEYSFGDPPLGR